MSEKVISQGKVSVFIFPNVTYSIQAKKIFSSVH